MKIPRKRLTTAGVMCAFVSLSFAPSPVNAADPQFDRIVDDYFAARFEYRPSEGTAAGLHEYDHRLEDLSESRAMGRIDELVQFKRRLATLKREIGSQQAKLPDDDEIDLIFLQWQVEAELIDLNVLRESDRNPMGYTGLPGSAGLDGRAGDQVVRRQGISRTRQRLRGSAPGSV
jgi:hypothetical protein